MRYRELGSTGFKASILGLGGHEFLPDGRSRGFNEDHLRATTPGVLYEGFGAEKRKADVVMLRYFAGLTLEETAEVLGVSKPTVDRDWRFARAVLYHELGPDQSH